MKANIYTSSNVDSIIEIVIDDLVNDIKITESNSLYSTILEVYENSKSTICIVKNIDILFLNVIFNIYRSLKNNKKDFCIYIHTIQHGYNQGQSRNRLLFSFIRKEDFY